LEIDLIAQSNLAMNEAKAAGKSDDPIN